MMQSHNAAAIDPVVARFEDGHQWTDTVWRYRVTTAGTRQAIYSMNWAVPLGDGGFLTDPKHGDMLEAWRRVLWTVTVEPPDGHPRKGSFCGKFGTGLRFLLPWMVATGRRDLGELDRSAFQEFLAALSEKVIGDAEEDIEEDADDGITDVTVSGYLVIFALPYFVRNELKSAGLPAPEDDPLEGKNALDIAQEICRKAVQQTPEVPDAVFVTTLNTAMAVLDAPWLDPLIELCNFISCTPEADHEARCTAFVKFYLQHVSAPNSLMRLFRSTVVNVRTACGIIVLASTAVRFSELCGIETKGYNVANGLPECIKVERTFDDEYEIFSLDARLFKHTPSSEPATWILGMRPTRSNYLPPPVRAVLVLYRLDEGWRRLADIDALLIQFATQRNVPSTGGDLSAAQQANIRLQNIRWMVETGCAGEDERITARMWRKTFARYLIRVSPDLLPAISHHLKHMSIAMTEVAYCRPAPSLRKLIEDARVEEAGSIIFSAITGKKRVEGPIAAEIQALGGELSRRLGNRPAESIATDIQAEVRERRIQLYGSDFGWCVFRGESARCHLLAEKPVPAFLRLAPEFGQKTAKVCQGCANFGIGDEHLAFWRERRAGFRDRLTKCDVDTPPSIKSILRRSIERCDTVLSWMGESANA